MPDFMPIVRQAYREILEREADSGGLDTYNRLMNSGWSEARMREALLRSPEYARNHPGFGLGERVGLNVHIPSDDILKDVAEGLGVPWVRVDFDWFRIEPTEGRFQWEVLDRVVETAWNLGLGILATLSFTPSWASSNPGDPKASDPPASIGVWQNAVRRSVVRYRDRIRHWQFWNEPNLTQFWNGTDEQYRTRILEPAARVAKDVHPECRIVSPGLANLRNWRAWFREVMKAKSFIDVVNHHNYAGDGRAAIVELRTGSRSRPSLRSLMREMGVSDRPFWITETGRRSDEGDQRQYYEDVLSTLPVEPWVDRLFFFHYWDGPGQGDGGFGIVNEDFAPKPAYFALRSALAETPALPASSVVVTDA